MAAPNLTLEEFEKLILEVSDGEDWKRFAACYRKSWTPHKDDWRAFNDDLKTGEGCAREFYAKWLLKI